MKSTLLLLISMSLKVSAATTAAPAPSFSLKDWTNQVQTAVNEGEDRKIEKLLDRSALENSLFVRSESPERATMKKARTLFAQGKYDQSISEYEKIQAGSPYWLEALEEKGWSALRKGDFEKALAQTKTLLSPHLRGVVGSEAFLLQSLSQLKACDYEASLETHKAYKESQKARLLALQSLADSGKSTDADAALSRVDAFPMTIKETGANASMLPRQFERDLVLQKAAFQMKTADAAIAILRASDSKASKMIPRLEREAQNARAVIAARLKKLARLESEENYDILQKLNLIEVDTIQRVHIDQELAKKQKTAKFDAVNGDELMFMDDGNPWIDELDHYQVKMNTCDQNLRRKM